MKILATRYSLLAICFAMLSLFGCTTLYRPKDPTEKKYLGETRKNIPLKEIRNDLPKYKEIQMALTGVVTDMRLTQMNEQNSELNLVVEHHRFDWIWDSGGIDFKHYYMSAKSDGKIILKMSVRHLDSKSENEALGKNLSEEFSRGNMVVFYGKPVDLKEDQIIFNGVYARGLPPSQFSLNGFYYPKD